MNTPNSLHVRYLILQEQTEAYRYRAGTSIETSNVITKDILAQWNFLKALRDEAKDKLARKFSLEFNFNSNHIERNTLTYGQTEALLLFGRVIGDAKMKDLEEMKAHNAGLKMVLNEAMTTTNPLTETFIRQVHKILLRGRTDRLAPSCRIPHSASIE